MNPDLYLEHLSDADLSLLATVAGGGTSVTEWLERVRSEPSLLERDLGHPSVFAALFSSGESDALLRASPFLVFAVLVHVAARELEDLPFVQEWVGPGRRVPMFDVAGLRGFASNAARRLFLAEVLASYTRVASGSTWVRTPRGWRRRRFSELDPLRLLELIAELPEGERAVAYRRLGDLSLFLTGVFPDYAAQRLLPALHRQRLERALSGVQGEGEPVSPGLHGGAGDIWLLEQLGRRGYGLAWRATEGSGGSVLVDVAEGFGQARRLLNFLTDRYLFPFRQQWFPLPDV